MGDLEQVLEGIVRDALEDDEAPYPDASTDGVAVDSLSAAHQTFHCEGELWLLDGGSWSVPLTATFWLSDDLKVVTSYEVKLADTDREAREAGAPPANWLVITATGAERR